MVKEHSNWILIWILGKGRINGRGGYFFWSNWEGNRWFYYRPHITKIELSSLDQLCLINQWFIENGVSNISIWIKLWSTLWLFRQSSQLIKYLKCIRWFTWEIFNVKWNITTSLQYVCFFISWNSNLTKH